MGIADNGKPGHHHGELPGAEGWHRVIEDQLIRREEIKMLRGQAARRISTKYTENYHNWGTKMFKKGEEDQWFVDNDSKEG